MQELQRYGSAIEEIKLTILQGQYQASQQVNASMLAMYYGIGRYISENSRKGYWGTGAIEYIANQLHKELPGLRGFSATNLRQMRLFYEAWCDVRINSSVMTDELQHLNNEEPNENFTQEDMVVVKRIIPAIPQCAPKDLGYFLQVSFTHHITIFSKCKTLQERLFYIKLCAEEHLPVRTLSTKIAQDLYHHQAELPNNFATTLPAVAQTRRAVEMFKDSYLLDFINVEEIGQRDKQDVDERVVEQEIIHNIKNFIMTFGHDFAFVGNQLHLEAYGEEQFPDLIFFNRELNALVVVELKRGAFKTAYLGQLSGYLRMVDDQMRKPHENHAIGIVLCQTANNDFVRYVIQDYDKPMGVATYATADEMPDRLRKALPNAEQLKHLLQQNI